MRTRRFPFQAVLVMRDVELAVADETKKRVQQSAMR